MSDMTVPYEAAPRRAVFRSVLNAIERLAWVDGWIGAGCLGVLILLMITEVTLRAISNVLPGVPAGLAHTWEYCSFLMAACFTFGAAMTLRTGGHIRVHLLLSRSSPGVRKALEILAAAVGLFATAFLTAAMARFTWTSFIHGQVSVSSGILLWMPQLVVTFGIFLLALQLLARLLQAVLDLPLEDERMKPASSME